MRSDAPTEQLDSKGESPFHLGRPVGRELFVGRKEEMFRILRAAHQVALGKQENVFIRGEYGIGKSSLAGCVRDLAQEQYQLAGFHVHLSGATTIEQMMEHVISCITHEAHASGALSRLRGLFGKYVEDVSLLGVKLNVAAIRKDTPAAAHSFVPFLRGVHAALGGDWKGIALILDDLNGITTHARFAPLLKSAVDEIALSGRPLPLLLILTGVEERRQEMIGVHQSVARIFNIAEVAPLRDDEVEEFFLRAFSSVDVTLRRGALRTLTQFAGGLPKLMHEIGDAAFWLDQDGVISQEDALRGVARAAENVGQKYFDPIYRALRSRDYRSIVRKLGKMGVGLEFRKADVAQRLSSSEKAKFNNFLQRMKKLGALRSSEIRGEYVFPNLLVREYVLRLGTLSK